MSGYATIDLQDIDLSGLRLVKETYQWLDGQDHSRWVFRSRRGGNYFKLWNPTYIRCDHILRGLESGFYDESTVPALQGVITSKGICRGYVMHPCKPVRKHDPDFHFVVLEKTARTGLFSVQYSRYHAMQYGQGFSLIDLEAIHPLSDLPGLTSRYHCFFDDPEYERFVIDVYHSMHPDFPAVQPGTSIKRERSGLEKLSSRFRTLRRWLSIRWSAAFHHVDRIEF